MGGRVWVRAGLAGGEGPGLGLGVRPGLDCLSTYSSRLLYGDTFSLGKGLARQMVDFLDAIKADDIDMSPCGRLWSLRA